MTQIFDPTDVSTLRTIGAAALAEFPDGEDQRFEFKSGRTPDGDLAAKLGRAASGFWNSGGGFLAAGVNGSGQCDGGVSLEVGRQSRRDWVDQILAKVTPRAKYEVAVVTDAPAVGTLADGNCVLIVGFEESANAPHMASDGRYYVRAGAHTEPASHFIVEAIRARRGLTTPQLTFQLGPSPDHPWRSELRLINLSPVPALDLVVTISPLPPLLQRRGSDEVRIRFLDTRYPGIVPFTYVKQGPNDWQAVDDRHTMTLQYHDPFGRTHRDEFTFLPRYDLPKPTGDLPALERIVLTLREIRDAVFKRKGP